MALILYRVKDKNTYVFGYIEGGTDFPSRSLSLIGGQFKKSGTWDPMYKVKAKIGWSFHSRELFISERNCTTVVQKLSALSIIYL